MKICLNCSISVCYIKKNKLRESVIDQYRRFSLFITPGNGYNSTMVIARSRLTTQGQISVPAEIRRKLGLETGSVLEWDEDDNGIFVRRVAQHSFESIHKRIFKVKPERKSLEELKDGITKNMRDRYEGR